MGLIPVNSIPTPSFAWLATRPIAEKCDSESVIVSANLPPMGKGLSVLTKHPDRLSVRTRATIVRPDSRSVSSTAPPKWWRGARRGLASRTVSISGIAVSSKHAQPISSYSRVCEIFHTVLCRALRAYDSEIRGAGILGQRSAGKPSQQESPAREVGLRRRHTWHRHSCLCALCRSCSPELTVLAAKRLPTRRERLPTG